jgi:hypothetical protein
MNSTISSAVRFWEKMQEKVKRLEEEEARLMELADKTVRAPVHTRSRISSGFGRGMLRKDKWQDGLPRITQEACSVVAEYAQAKIANPGSYVGRKHFADRAGLSTSTLNRCADQVLSGEIFLDPTDGVWKVDTVRTNKETRLPPIPAREKNPHGVPSQVALA